ncbi:hypothetical protein Gotur_026511, partial [Gossypium turneri]
MQEEVSKIGVWGMGGVGKTTIIKHIHNDILKQQRFERVILVTISKEFNVMKVQDNIASELEAKEYLDKEEDKLRRAAILSEKLKNAGEHVLILDDVWDKVSLEEKAPRKTETEEDDNNDEDGRWKNVLDLEEAKKQVLFSLPMIVTNVVYHSITLVSVMFAGHLGELQLAGATLANSWA